MISQDILKEYQKASGVSGVYQCCEVKSVT